MASVRNQTQAKFVEGRAVTTASPLFPKIPLTLQNLSRVPMNYHCLIMAIFKVNGHSLHIKTI